MSDIVERLREAVDEDCWAAADEIARLRALNEELVGALETIRAMLDPDSSDEWACLQIDALLARAKGGSDG